MKTYFDVSLTMGFVNFSFGLNLFPAINEMTDWIQKFSTAMAQPFEEPQEIIKIRANLKKKAPLPVSNRESEKKKFNSWDKMRHNLHGNFIGKSTKKIKFNLLTSIHPYSLDSICVFNT